MKMLFAASALISMFGCNKFTNPSSTQPSTQKSKIEPAASIISSERQAELARIIGASEHVKPFLELAASNMGFLTSELKFEKIECYDDLTGCQISLASTYNNDPRRLSVNDVLLIKVSVYIDKTKLNKGTINSKDIESVQVTIFMPLGMSGSFE